MRHSRALWSGVFAFAMAAGCESVEPWEGEPDIYESDDSRESAKELRINGLAESHTFSPDGDSDWIRVRLDQVDLDTPDPDDGYGPLYYFECGDVVGSPQIRVYDPLGNDVGGGSPPIRARLTTPGIHYLKVHESSGVGGEYAIRAMLAKVRQSAGDGALADIVLGGVTVPPEVDEGATVTVSVRTTNQGDKDAPGYNIELYLSADRVLDAGDVLLVTSSVADLLALYFTTSSISAQLPAAVTGPVYIIARAITSFDESDKAPFGEQDSSNNVYCGSTLIVPAGGDLADVDEGNDDQANATAWDGSPLLDRTFHVMDDIDVYAFDADPAMCYEIWTELLRGDANTLLQVYKSDFTTPAGSSSSNDDGGCENFASFVRFTPSEIANYYVDEPNTRDGSGAYDLRMLTGSPALLQSDAYEPDDLDAADAVRPFHTLLRGISKGRSLSTIDDVDWMVYCVSKDDHQKNHTITCTPQAGLVTTLTLYRSTYPATGRVVAAATDAIAPQLAAGMYYLKIERHSSSTLDCGTYSLLATAP